ncbi:MAG: carbohydrate ABC transporter permease [Atribacterota bacterium]|nr:carbohydrate ABC transporter permease [Atribacterota bacterium]
MKHKHSSLLNFFTYLFILLVSAFVLAPLLWFLVTSLKPTADVLAFPPRLIPRSVTFEHYSTIIFGSNASTYFKNSLFVAVSTILLTLIIASHMGYAAARFKFIGKNYILFGLLATSMIPGIAILPVLYLLSMKLNLNDTHIVLILVYSAWQIPIVTWIMRAFFESINPELEEAARIDGCTRMQAFYRVILPLSQPGLAASSILVFIYVWYDWLVAQYLTISENMQLVNVGLYSYIRDTGVEWGKFTAYSILTIIPVIALFLILQTRFIEGLTAGGVKG